MYTGLEKIMCVYSELDTLINNFKTEAQFDCIKKCKKCCNTSNQNIEVTILEFLPLSNYLWKKNRADYWLKKLAAAKPDSPCVLLKEDNNALSGCTYYSYRPLLCRLFGFAAMLNKKGKPQITLCKEINNLNPTLNKKVQMKIDKGLQVPIYPYFSQKISSLDPFLGEKKYPINEAFKLALEKIGLNLSYQSYSAYIGHSA